MNTATTPSTLPPRSRGAAGLLLALVALGLLAYAGWRAWQHLQAQEQRDARVGQEELAALRARLDGLRGDQRTQLQRLQQADATNRLLRDELLGLGQRAGLLEDSVRKLADPERHGAQALRLDEVELLLSQGAQQLQLSGDLVSTRRAYGLAAGLLDGVEDPAYLSLHQTLDQERAALDALDADPKAIAAGRLDAFVAGLVPPSGSEADPVHRDQAWWQRAFARVFVAQPSQGAVALTAQDRGAGFAALQLELAIARAAMERRDAAAYRAALQRAAAWLPRLWRDSPARRASLARLRALRTLPLRIDLPTFGSSLEQLRSMRASH